MKVCKNCGKKFKPQKGFEKKQVDCSENCLANRFDKLTRKTRKIARIYAGTMGYRSMFEVRFKALCTAKKINLNYEVKTVDYQHKPQKYTADFTQPRKQIHFECKGVLNEAAKKKLKAVKRCNPNLDLRLVFEKPNNKLSRKAKWTYATWAEKNGFKWYDWHDINKIKREMK